MKMMIWMGASCIAMALSARATLTHTNGNFDAGVAAGDNNNVPDWFDGNHHPGAAWEDTWLNTVNIPSGQSGGTVGFSGNVPTATNFLYQSLGTRSADETMLCFSISVGAFTDGAVGTKTGTLHVGLYEQTGSFTGADGTDIAGASGIVQVGSTVALPISRVGGPGAVASDETGSFDISGVSTSHTLYLRYQWIPTGGSYMSVDNASISTVDTRPFTLATQRVVRAAEFADGQTCITVGLAGVPNRIYQIQYSTDMSPGSWSILAPYSTGATGLFEATFTKPGDVAADWNGRLFFRALDAMSAGSILKSDALRTYVASFNSQRPDDTSEGLAGDGSVTAIRNNQAAEWMEKNVPLFECSDKDIEEIYHFRWWTYRKHIRNTPDGFVVTEFLPQVSWSKKHNTINCPVGHHLYEGRWLRDPKIIDDYTRFYFGKGGDPGGTTKSYSNWITDGIYARYLVNADEPFITGLLDALVKDHEAWKQDGAAGDAFQKSRLVDNGLYWQCDSWEGQEYSIGGTGIRPPINSYQFGGAMAIARIAELAGRTELAGQYRAEAGQLQRRVQEELWDPQANFFKVKRHELAQSNYPNFAAVACEPGQRVNVREIFGLVPWYFNLPEGGCGYEDAWRQLIDPQGFQAPYGPTVAERRHPNFMINEAGCQWRGASWPFSTAQTLTALANVLNHYTQAVLGKKEYFDTLKTYTRSHRLTLGDGRVVPWIDESLNPDTGRWIMNDGQYPNTRGRNYNHSTYCDLVITGLVGLRPRADDLVEVNPLVPEGASDFFCLDNVSYHGRNLTILWDKTGVRYGRGVGLRVLADGREIAHSETLARVTGKLNGPPP